jgi:hypothetical protein
MSPLGFQFSYLDFSLDNGFKGVESFWRYYIHDFWAELFVFFLVQMLKKVEDIRNQAKQKHDKACEKK